MFLASCLTMGCSSRSSQDYEYHVRLWETQYILGSRLVLQRDFEKAIATQKQAISEAEAIGSSNFRLLVSLNDLASTYQTVRDYKSALEQYKRAFEVCKILKSSEASQASLEAETVKTLNGLGDAYQALNQFDTSKTYYEQALSITEKQRSGKGIARPHMAEDMIVGLIGLGNAAWAAGAKQEARSYFQKALSLEQFSVISSELKLRLLAGSEKAMSSISPPDKSPTTATGQRQSLGESSAQDSMWQAITSAGLQFLSRGDFSQAEHKFNQALRLAQKAKQPDSHLTESLKNLAVVYEQQNRFAEAENCLNRALKLMEVGERSQIPPTLIRLAKVQEQNHELAKAAQTYLRVAEGKAETVDRLDMVVCLSHLGKIYLKLKDFPHAEEYSKRALSLNEQNLGLDHPDLQDTLEVLADICNNEGKTREAADYTRRLEAIQEKAFGSDSAQNLAHLKKLGLMYGTQRDPVNAERMFRRALAVKMARLKDQKHRTDRGDALDLAETQTYLGRVVARQEKLGEAQKYFDDARTLLMEHLSLDDPRLLDAVVDSVNNYYFQKQHLKAAETGTAFLKLRPALNRNNPAYQGLLRTISHSFVGANKNSEAVPIQELLINTLVIQHGKDSIEVAAPLRFLASIYRRLDQPEKAIAILQASMPNWSKMPDKSTNPEYIATISELSLSYVQASKGKQRHYLDKAEQIDIQALDALRKKGNHDPLSEAILLEALTIVYRSQGRLKLTESTLKDGLDILAKNLEKYRSQAKHRHFARIYVEMSQSYASLLRSHGRDEEAEKLMQLANAIKLQEKL